MALRSASRRPVARPNSPAQLAEDVLVRADVAPGARDLVAQDLGKVKCWNSATMSAKASWKASTSGFEGRMKRRCMPSRERGGLVRHHVVRQAGEDHAARQVVPGSSAVPVVAEEQRHLGRAVVGVGVAQRVRVDAQPLHEVRVVLGAHVLGRRAGSPQRAAAQGALEVADGERGHGINHLLVELGRALGGREAVLGQEHQLVQVDGLVEALARRVDVDHLEVLAHRAGFELLPGDGEGQPADRRGLQALGEAGVHGVAAQPAVGRPRVVA